MRLSISNVLQPIPADTVPPYALTLPGESVLYGLFVCGWDLCVRVTCVLVWLCWKVLEPKLECLKRVFSSLSSPELFFVRLRGQMFACGMFGCEDSHAVLQEVHAALQWLLVCFFFYLPASFKFVFVFVCSGYETELACLLKAIKFMSAPYCASWTGTIRTGMIMDKTLGTPYIARSFSCCHSFDEVFDILDHSAVPIYEAQLGWNFIQTSQRLEPFFWSHNLWSHTKV